MPRVNQPMKKGDLEKIKRNFSFLKEELDQKEIRDAFIKNGLFDLPDWEKIDAVHPKQKQNEVFLILIMRSGPNAYEVFLEVLKEKRYDHIVDKLNSTVITSQDERIPTSQRQPETHMKKADQEKIRKNFSFLKEELHQDEIRDTFMDNGLFDIPDYEEIDGVQPRQKQNEVFLKLMMRSGPDAYQVFLEVLEKKGSDHIIEKLNSTVITTQDERIPELQSQPDILRDSNLEDLATKIGRDYEILLLYLRLSSPEIDQIKAENPRQITLQTKKGLSFWRDKQENKQFEELVKELLNALNEVGRKDLVDEMTEKYKFQVYLSDCRKENNDITIVCNIFPTPDLSFSIWWEKDGDKIDVHRRTDKYMGGTSSDPSLRIQKFEDDCGSYQCFVSSVIGTFGSNKFNLKPPDMKELIPVQAPGAPANVMIQCNVLNDYSPSLSNIMWMKDDVQIEDKSKYSGGHIKEPSLTIINAGKMDRGTYTCVAENIIGDRTSKVSLDVPTVWITGPSAINYEECAVFSATISSQLKITSYAWQKTAPNSAVTTLNRDEEKYTGSSNDKLVINVATHGDTAEYRLVVANILGEGKSNGILFIVKEDIFGRKELWKTNDKCKGITRKNRWKLYMKLFWNKREKTFSCKVEELRKHLDIPYEDDNLECQDDSTEFDSEESEKMTLWDFLHEKGDIAKNIKFWFEKSSDNSIIEKYCVSPEYFREETETAIRIPSQFLQEFVKKLHSNILEHRTMKDKSIYPCVGEILKIPTEILSSGNAAFQNYLKQLSKGNVHVYHARGMIVGCAGAGKTTLLKKLKELPLEDIRNTKSTRGVDIQADVFTVSRNEISVTSEKVLTHFNNKSSTIRMTEETLSDKQELDVSPDEDYRNPIESGRVNEQQNPTNTRTDDTYEQSFEETKSDDGVRNKQSSKNTYLDSQLAVQIDKKPKKKKEKKLFFRSDENLPGVQEKKALKNVEKKASFRSDETKLPGVQEKQALEPIQLHSLLSAIKDDNPKTITIFDFAGQLAYYVTHQMHLNPRSFYVLVIDMTKNLDDAVEEEAEFKRWTYKELIEHWMKMIHAIHRSAPVILVATHAEGKSKQDIEQFFVQIWKLIPKDIREGHLDHKRQFAVELENSSGIAKIKESILNIVSTAKHWGEVRPSSWVMFENYLMNAKTKIKVMKMEDLWTENKKLPIEYQLEEKDDMKKMLQFFHDTGMILYYDEDVLRDVIILDVPWFVDAFKHIITDPLHATEDFAGIEDIFESTNFTCGKALDDLQESGILSVSLLRAVWKIYENVKSEQKDTYVQNMKGIMRYMERLGMIAKMTTNPEEIWYVPCMNKRSFSKKEFEDYSVSSIVCFKFKFLPPSIYHRLIASCISLLGFAILRWPEPEYFHKNAVLVHRKDFDYKYYFLIGSVELESTIEIQVLREKGFKVDRKNCRNFKLEITDQLERLMNTFHNNLESFEIGYRCRNTIFSDETKVHFIEESNFKERTIICPECKPPNRILCENVLSPWNKVSVVGNLLRWLPKMKNKQKLENKQVVGEKVNTQRDLNIKKKQLPGSAMPTVRMHMYPDIFSNGKEKPRDRYHFWKSEQARKANDNSNRDVGGNVGSQGVTFILETSLDVPGGRGCIHISCVSSESAWVSDRNGKLRQVDKHGSVIKTVSGRRTLLYNGSHTVTRDGDLLFIDSKDRRVYRVAGEEQILTLQTDQCELLCIFSSPRNGDLLIGGQYRDDRGEERGVALRYNNKGDTCIQKIERDQEERHLYTEPPYYITENMNGDVIVSDWMDDKLVVVDKSGRHRFTYTGHPSGSLFSARGVCTDTSGRILLCDPYSYSVHILTRDGEFLSRLQTEDHGIVAPWSICMDNEQRVWVVDRWSNRVCIYRYPAPQ